MNLSKRAKIKHVQPGVLFVTSLRTNLFEYEAKNYIANGEKLIVDRVDDRKFWVTCLDGSGSRRSFRLADFIQQTKRL